MTKLVTITTTSKTARIRDSSGSRSGGGSGSYFQTEPGFIGYAGEGVTSIRRNDGTLLYSKGGGGTLPTQPTGEATIANITTTKEAYANMGVNPYTIKFSPGFIQKANENQIVSSRNYPSLYNYNAKGEVTSINYYEYKNKNQIYAQNPFNQSINSEPDMREGVNFISRNGYTIGEENPYKQQSILYKIGIPNRTYNFKSNGSQFSYPFIPPWKVNPKNSPFQFYVMSPIIEGFNMAESFVMGGAKQLYYPNYSPNKSVKPLIDIGQDKYFRTNLLMDTEMDTDVQNFWTVVGLTTLAYESPVVGGVISTGFLGTGLYMSTKGIMEQNPQKYGTGIVFTVSSIPGTLKLVQRGWTELVGEKVKSSDVFGGRMTGKRIQASSLKESLDVFESEGREYGLKTIISGKGARELLKNPQFVATRKALELPQVRMPSPGRLEVSTGTPGFLRDNTLGLPDETGIYRGGAKGQAGIEDEVIYFAPKGRVNPGFLGLSKQASASPSSISFPDYRGIFSSQPTASNFFVEGYTSYPREIINQPGFAGLNPFIEGTKGTGFLIITKRKELGFQNIQRQMFTPIKTIELKTRTMVKGQYYMEGGTTEMELGGSPGSLFRSIDVGFRERFRYTLVEPKKLLGKEIPFTGELVRLPKYEFVIEKNLMGNKVLNGRNTFSLENIAKRERESSYNYERKKSQSEIKSYTSFKISSSPSREGLSIFSEASKSLPSITSMISSPIQSSISRGRYGSSFKQSISRISTPDISNPKGYSRPSNPPPSIFSVLSSLPIPKGKYNSYTWDLGNKRIEKNSPLQKKFTNNFKVPFMPKYFASIEATAFGIKGRKNTDFTGLELRPIGV